MQWDWLIYFVLFLVYIEIPLRRIENFKNEKEIIKTSNNPKKIKKIRNSPYIMICFMSIIFCIIFLIEKIFDLNIQLPYQSIGLLLFTITLCLFDWIIKSENISLNISIIVIVLEILAVIGVNGYFNGNKAKLKEIKEILIFNDNKKIHCAVLRNFNNVILIKDINSYMFISKSDIKAIKYSK